MENKMKQKIKFYIGLPGSGKTTLAKAWVEEDPVNRVRVNKDELRLLLHQGKYSKGNENQVLAIQDEIIIDSLNRGKSIAIDNTHLVSKHLDRLKNLLKVNSYNEVEIDLEDLSLVSPEECIKNDLKRSNSVGQDVIWRMYWDHIAKIEEQPNYENKKWDAIIVDVDGTLADMGNRHPYEWDKVGNDQVRTHIKELVNIYMKADYKVIILTGRDGSCYRGTLSWLQNNGIGFDKLYSRAAEDCRKDFIVKKEIYNKYILPYYNVRLIVDDRPQVIREWRRLGLPVINANPCDREF